MWPGISSLTVDVHALATISHACRGCAPARRCCCASYDVCMTAREMRTVIGMLPYAAEYCPSIREGGDYANIFEETEDGLYSLDTDEHGLCVLAYRSEAGVRCALHSAALCRGISPSSVKPLACTLWPLTLSEASNAHLAICGDALAFTCTRSRIRQRRAISPAILQTIGELFGEKARSEVSRAAAKGLRMVRIRLRRTRLRCKSRCAL